MQTEVKVGTAPWREAHCQLGDNLLELADTTLGYIEREQEPAQIAGLVTMAQLYVSMAQAHYAAANVRHRPATYREM